MTIEPAHTGTAQQLITVHNALRQVLARIREHVDTAPFDSVAEAARLYATLLDGHHRMEDAFLFPVLRSDGKLRSTDAAFLDARIHEHAQVHRLCTALSGSRSGAVLRAVTTELTAVLEPHLAEEEAVLTARHLSEMVSGPALADATKRAQSANIQDPSTVQRLANHPLLEGIRPGPPR